MAEIYKTESNNSNAVREEVKSFIYLIILALSIRILIFEPFHIPSGSMRKTLIEGDYVFSTKYSYGYSKHSFLVSPNLFSGRILASLPERGDVIIFRPSHRMTDRFIKRLIGLPGDKIELKDGAVYINDNEVKRDLIAEYQEAELTFKEYEETLPEGKKYAVRYIVPQELPSHIKDYIKQGNNIGPFYVPQDHYFFLGDNRDQSGDSRSELGFVPFENFISKAQFVLFSFEKNLWLDDPLSFDQILQVGRWIASFRLKRLIHIIE